MAQVAKRDASQLLASPKPGQFTVHVLDEALRISIGAPGWRAPILGALLGVVAAGAISTYWLLHYPGWGIGCGLFWLGMMTRAASAAGRTCIITIGSDEVLVETRTFFGAAAERVAVSPDTGASVQRDVEPFTVDLFPEHYLLIEDRGTQVEALRSHDPLLLAAVRKLVLSQIEQSLSLRATRRGA